MPLEIPVLAPLGPSRIDPDCTFAAAVERMLGALAGADAVTIVLNDPQRGTNSAPVLERLAGLACAPEARLLVATGTHPFLPAERKAFEAHLLAALPAREIAWNDCRSDDRVLLTGPAGRQWHGHPWLVDERPALLAIGSSEPHYFAGITGAHKTVTIGCAAHADIQANHSLSLSPDARAGRLEGNPVHEGIAVMVRALQARREVVAMNLFQVGSDILAASAGDPLEALERIAPLVRDCYFLTIPAAADAIVLDVDGPLGRSFYQAHKAIANNEWAVRDGGTIVLEAPLSSGVGQDCFMDLLGEGPTYDRAERILRRRGYRLADQKALKLRYLTDRREVRVFAVSAGLSAADAQVLGLTLAASVEAALAEAGVDPAGQTVYRIADAANTCTRVG